MAQKAVVPRFVAAGILFCIPIVILWSSLFAGQAFVPGDLLHCVAPWSNTGGSTHPPPWNVLRFDGVTQFYPWRLEAARAIHQGRLPFWNPYTFAASGGTPLWANSQSAPLYPLNSLFYLVPIHFVWYVFGFVTVLHLELAAAGTYLFLRRTLSTSRLASLLGAITFALSGPITCWLALPTFLSVACWIPWLLLFIHAAFRGYSKSRTSALVAGIGTAGGLMILGGHLQVSLYGLSIGLLYALFCGFSKQRSTRSNSMCILAATAAGLIAICLAAPQLLPAIELSRVSHRASAGFPTWSGYEGYVSNALPIRNLVTLLFPNFFGHPNWDKSTYWNSNNYGEWALFTGITPLLLSFFAIGLPLRSADTIVEGYYYVRERRFFASIAMVTLLIAMGSLVNVPLFFLLPGYSQTGNPGRILVVFAFAMSVLGAIGLDTLCDRQIAKQVRERATLVALGAPALLAAFGASKAAVYQRDAVPGSTLADLIAPAMPSIFFGICVFAAGALLILLVGRRFANQAPYALVFIAAAELMNWGWGYNPAVPAADLYRVTPGISYLQKNATQTDLVAPINRGWSLWGAGPKHAVLPPNELTVFGLHDIAGYDSLFLKTAKDQIREAGDDLDPSPPENGNMLFIKDPEIAVRLGARFIVAAPDAPLENLPANVKPVYEGPDLLIYENTRPKPFNFAPSRAYAPASIRIGLFAAMTVLSMFSAAVTTAVTVLLLRLRRRHGSRSSL